MASFLSLLKRWLSSPSSPRRSAPSSGSSPRRTSRVPRPRPSRGALKKAGAAGIPAAALAAFLSLAPHNEGLRTVAYWDPYGQVWTVCYGDTENVHKGDRYTAAECDQKLVERIQRDFDPGVMAVLNQPVPDLVRGAFDDLAYNIGVHAFQGSTVVKRWNKGDFKGACDAVLMWNMAGGKVLKGLVRRRHEEQAKCLEGIKEL